MSECEFRTTQQTSKGESGTTEVDIEKRVLHHFVGDIALLETQYHSGWSFRRPPVAALQLVT